MAQLQDGRLLAERAIDCGEAPKGGAEARTPCTVGHRQPRRIAARLAPFARAGEPAPVRCRREASCRLGAGAARTARHHGMGRRAGFRTAAEGRSAEPTSAGRRSMRSAGFMRRSTQPGLGWATSSGGSSARAKACAKPRPRSAGRRGRESWCSPSRWTGSPTITASPSCDRGLRRRMRPVTVNICGTFDRSAPLMISLRLNLVAVRPQGPSPSRTEKGIEFELKPRGIGDPDPDFCAASPFRKMPALQDGDYCLADSAPFATTSRRSMPTRSSFPPSPKARGKDNLVRRVRRHHPIWLRAEGLLQSGRGAALPQPAGRRSSRRGRIRDELPADPRLSGKRRSRATTATSSATR